VIPPQFDGFFQAATKKPSPYNYQRRVACGERNVHPEAEWLAAARNAIPDSSTSLPVLAKPPPSCSHGFGTMLTFRILSGRADSFIAYQCGQFSTKKP